jgi:hypothetical protein
VTLAEEIRAETARIIKRNFGLPGELAAIKLATVQKIDAYVEDAQDKLARCTCDHAPEFTIDTRRDRPLHAMFIARRLDRMRMEDAR